MRAEDPEGVERGDIAMEWGSDALAELLRRLGLDYIALVPGSSYRGLHDSLVNYNGNRDPQLLVCLHEEHAVAIAHGYAKVTGASAGGGDPQQRRPDAREHGHLQRLLRPGADADHRRHRPGRRGQAAALDRLDSHLRRPGRADQAVLQMGRSARLGRGGPELARPGVLDHPGGAFRADLRVPRRQPAGAAADGAAGAARRPAGPVAPVTRAGRRRGQVHPGVSRPRRAARCSCSAA